MQEHLPERCYNPSEEGVGLGLSGLNARCFRFGPFELNSQTCELRKHGVKLKLPEQPCKILLAHVERPGELVCRGPQAAALDPDTFVDFEHGLNVAVRCLPA